MRIVISKELAEKAGSEGAALIMLGLAERVCPKTGEVIMQKQTKPRQKGRKAPARGKPSAGPMRPKKGKGSFKRQQKWQG